MNQQMMLSHKKVLEIDPNHFGALFNIGVIYNDLKII